MTRKGLFGFEQKIRSLAASPEREEFLSSRLAWFSPLSAHAVALFAFLLIAMLDLVAGILLSPSAEAEAPIGSLMAQILALAAVSAVALGTALWLVSKTLRRASARLTAFLAGLSLVGLWLSQGISLLDGEGFRNREDAEIQRPLILTTLSLVFFFLGWFATKRLLIPVRAQRRSGSISWALCCFLGAVLLVLADAKVLVGGYPEAHGLAAIGSILAALLATTEIFIILEDRVPSRPIPILIALGLSLVLGLGALTLARQSEDIHRLRAELLEADYPFARKALSLYESLFLDQLIPLTRPKELDAQALMEEIWPEPIESGLIDQKIGIDRRRFNIVLISTDTLRHDCVGWSGERPSNRELTPNVDAWAQDSLTFERAYSPYPTSSYAYSSALTGLYPRRSPARSILDPKIEKSSQSALPHVLQRAGYQTFACTAFTAAGIGENGPFGHVRHGFDVVNPRGNMGELDAPAITADAIDLIDRREKTRPFLLWVHYMDPHASYKKHPGSKFDFGSSPRGLYHGEVAYMDFHMAALFERLRSEDLLANTIVVFFSDHGESFNEHDTSYHNSNLYDEQIRIPVSIRIPKVAPRHLPFQFNLVDLCPTLLALTGHGENEPQQGRDLSGALLDLGPQPTVDFSYSERFPRDPLRGRESERALVYEGKKLIRFAGDASARVYDLKQDPGELHNIFDPQDEEHQLLLGFMSALDLMIDGKSARDKQEDYQPQISQAEAALSSLQDLDQGPDFVILADLARIFFDGELRYKTEVAAAFGDKRMAQIVDVLTQIVSDETRVVKQRQAAFKFLTSLPRDEVRPFMQLCLHGPREAQLGAALWFASRGEDDGRAILLSGLESQPGDWSMNVAASLSAMGERAAIPFLIPGLERNLGDSAAESVRALSRIGHYELDSLLRSLISADSTGLMSRKAQIACVEVLASNHGPDSDFLLARLGCSVFPEVRRGARDLLAERCSQERQETILAMAANEVMADQSLGESDHANALRAFREAEKIAESGRVDDAFLHYKMARCAAESGDLDAARTYLNLARVAKNRSQQLKDAIRSLDRSLAMPESLTVDVSALLLRAEFVGPTAALPLRQGEFFARRVRLTNTSTLPILGGAAPKSLRLVWYFRKENGELEGLGSEVRVPARFLPEKGLAAGESIDILTLGRLPGYPGNFEPCLVIAREPWVTDGFVEVLTWPTTVVW